MGPDQVFHQAFTYIPTFCMPNDQAACYSPAIVSGAGA